VAGANNVTTKTEAHNVEALRAEEFRLVALAERQRLDRKETNRRLYEVRRLIREKAKGHQDGKA
jgi:hypothetical protein